MGWKLVFWDAKSPDSALGIFADCVLGNVNVRPTGNRGVPLTPSCRWMWSRDSRDYKETGTHWCKRLRVSGFMYIRELRVQEGDSWQARSKVYTCKGRG